MTNGTPTPPPMINFNREIIIFGAPVTDHSRPGLRSQLLQKNECTPQDILRGLVLGIEWEVSQERVNLTNLGIILAHQPRRVLRRLQVPMAPIVTVSRTLSPTRFRNPPAPSWLPRNSGAKACGLLLEGHGSPLLWLTNGCFWPSWQALYGP